MSVLFILVIIGIIVASVFLIAFIWAVRSGQYDDSYTPSVRMLFDDEKVTRKESANQAKSKSEEKPN